MKLVLDTNVIIDWLVFDDPFMNPLRDAVGDGRVVVVTHPPAIEELQRVLGYPALELEDLRQREVLERYQSETSLAQLAERLPVDRLELPKGFPRCRDPDDNHFLALAYHAKADALVSRDKALLKLKRRAAKHGFEILDVQQMIAKVASLPLLAMNRDAENYKANAE